MLLKIARKLLSKITAKVYVYKSPLGDLLVCSFFRNPYWKEVLSNYFYDLERYSKFASSSSNDYDNLKARITANYHVIEKGLSLKETRLGFGKETISYLCSCLNQYIQNGYNTDNEQFQSAVRVLSAYCEFHNQRQYDVSDIQQKLEPYKDYIDQKKIVHGGSIRISKDDILDTLAKHFEDLANSRHSIRNFSDNPVDISLVIRAISIANKTPSVCNRQSCFVYVLDNKDAKNKALSCQNGNRGFGDRADKVLVVTSNLRSFFASRERNQAFIDGGMFAMTLIYALHSLGLGSCPLNWAVNKREDTLLRELLPIEDKEVVIMMIAVGNLPDEFQVACSQRKPIEECYKII